MIAFAALLAAGWFLASGFAEASATDALPALRRDPGRLPRIVFVSRNTPSDSQQIPGLGPLGRGIAPGGRLLVRERNGDIRPLLSAGTFFDVSDPAVSWDAKWVAFAAVSEPDGPWRIWVVREDGRELRPATRDDRPAGALAGIDATRFARYDDFDPCWLPDGRICFSSTRWPMRAQPADVPATNLFVTRSGDEPPGRTTSERSGADEPAVDPATGRVVYARWWTNRFLALDRDPFGITLDRARAVPGDTVDLWTAVSVTPDGDGVKLAAGDARERAAMMAYQPVVLAKGDAVGVWASNPSLEPAPGRVGLQRFAGGIGEATRIAGPGTAIPGDACSPAALPDGRIVFAWAPPTASPGGDLARDFGLYVMDPDGRRLARVADLPGTLELDPAVLAPRPLPPPHVDEFPDPPLALAPATHLETVYDRAKNTFRFDCLNVFANGAVDAAIPDAPPLASGLRIRFYATLSRPDAAGGDSLVLLREMPVDASGAVHVDDMAADTPSFEQLVDAEGRVVRSARGPAHVTGFNFARLGGGTKCVGCHVGHSAIPPELNYWRAKWFNAAPSARVRATSTGTGNAQAAVDRRTRGAPDQVAWVADGAAGQKLRLEWNQTIEVRRLVLYSIRPDPAAGTSLRVRETQLDFYRGDQVVKHLTVRELLRPEGTRVECEPVRVDAIEIAPTVVSGLVQRRRVVGLAEVEASARLVED